MPSGFSLCPFCCSIPAATVAELLQRKGTGAVTCLYKFLKRLILPRLVSYQEEENLTINFRILCVESIFRSS